MSDLTQPASTPASLAPIDVARPELFAEDRWQEPFATLRARDPIHYVPDSKFGPYWSVTTYKPIVHIEALPKIFSSSWERGGITLGVQPNSARPSERRMPQFISMDPPQHTGQRRTVAPAFGPAEIARMKAEVAERTGALLDSLPLGTPFDWVKAVSIELTTGMLAKLFGFPWEERHRLTEWSDIGGAIDEIIAPGGWDWYNGKMDEMGAAFAQLWQQRAQEPGNDLISTMLRSDAMAQMDPVEFIGNMILLIVGGNDTTRNSMTAYAYGLSKYPDERRKLEADPALIPNAVQELIRWQTPLAYMRRTVTEDTEVHGVAMRKDDMVALWYLSANRDESVFPDGERIIVDRPNARRHLSFGYGIHRCVGARVAELQLVTLLDEMARRRLRVEAIGEPERVPASFVHGYRSLIVELSRY
jgi:cytochrome P450